MSTTADIGKTKPPYKNNNAGKKTQQPALHYPFWFGGSASCCAATVTHPLDLGTSPPINPSIEKNKTSVRTRCANPLWLTNSQGKPPPPPPTDRPHHHHTSPTKVLVQPCFRKLIRGPRARVGVSNRSGYKHAAQMVRKACSTPSSTSSRPMVHSVSTAV